MYTSLFYLRSQLVSWYPFIVSFQREEDALWNEYWDFGHDIQSIFNFENEMNWFQIYPDPLKKKSSLVFRTLLILSSRIRLIYLYILFQCHLSCNACIGLRNVCTVHLYAKRTGDWKVSIANNIAACEFVGKKWLLQF